MRFPKHPNEDAEEAVEILTSLRLLLEYGDPIGSRLADAALKTVAHRLSKSGVLDALVTRR